MNFKNKGLDLFIVCLFFLILGTPLIFRISGYEVFATTKLAFLRLLIFAIFLYFLGSGFPKRGKGFSYLIFPSLFFISIIFSFLIQEHKISGIQGLYLNIMLLFLYYIIINRLDVSHIIICLYFVVLSGVIVGLYSIIQHFGYDFVSWSRFHIGRSSSTIGNPNTLGSFISMIIPINFGLLFLHKRRILFISLFILFFGLFFTFHRAGYLSSIFSLLLFFILTYRIYKKEMIKTFLLFFLIAIIIISFNPNQLHSFFLKSHSKNEFAILDTTSLKARLSLWDTSIKIIKDNLLFGTGFGTYQKIVYPRYNKGEIYRILQRPDIAPEDPHNEFINIAVSSGIFGLFSYLGIIIFSFITGASLLKEEKNISLLSAILISSLLSYIVSTSFIFKEVSSYLYFFLFISFIFALKKNLYNEEIVYLKFSKNKILIYLFIPIIAFLGTFFLTREVVADYHFHRALAFRFYNTPHSIENFKEAIKLNRYNDEYRFRLANYYAALGKVNKKSEKFWAKESINELKELIKIHPYARYHGQLGKIYFLFSHLENFKELAIKEYEIAVKLEPFQPIYRNGLGLCYMKKNDFERAEEEFLRVIEIYPYWESYYNLSILYKKQNRIDISYKFYKKAKLYNKDIPEFDKI